MKAEREVGSPLASILPRFPDTPLLERVDCSHWPQNPSWSPAVPRRNRNSLAPRNSSWSPAAPRRSRGRSAADLPEADFICSVAQAILLRSQNMPAAYREFSDITSAPVFYSGPSAIHFLRLMSRAILPAELLIIHPRGTKWISK